MADFLSRLKEVKKERRLSNEIIADRMGISASVVTNYFNGRTEIPVSVIDQLCRVLGTSVEYIITGGGAKESVEGVAEELMPYGNGAFPTSPDVALRTSVEALITMYHRVEVLMRKTDSLERDMINIRMNRP